MVSMSSESPLQAHREDVRDFEAQRTQTIEELRRYFAFADPLIGVDWGEKDVPEDYTPEYVAAHPELTQVYLVKDGSGEIIAGAKVKMLDAAEKNRLGLEQGNFANQSGALLEYAAVKKEYRNNKILADLTKKRIEWAKEHGATYVCSEAEITNPISIYTKIRDGFVLVNVQEPSASEGVVHPYFVEVKNVAPNEGEARKEASSAFTPEWKEVLVTEESFSELKSLFVDGWIGVDIKGADEDPEKLRLPWRLVLERNLIT